MKKIYILWMALGALALGIVLFIYFKGEAISNLLHKSGDNEEIFEKG